jgi:NAD(P)-dependent dehydrogenase (short-subunit alcohol dehydrogenase family)
MATNKNILITGCSTGFGVLMTHTLLSAGHMVLATMRDLSGKNAANAEELLKAAHGSAGKLHLLELDVLSDESVNAAVAKAQDISGGLDVVINNAGYGVGGFLEGFSSGQLKDILDTNVVGVHRVVRAVLPHMREKGSGLILNISSAMGRIVIPFAAPYTASKFALEGLTESLRYEVSGTGVDVVIVQPGGFGTDFMQNMGAPEDGERIQSYGELQNAPDQLWGGFSSQLSGDEAPNPQDVADAVLELISMPADSQPVRTVVDPMTGEGWAEAINKSAGEMQDSMLTAFGMGDLLAVKVD